MRILDRVFTRSLQKEQLVRSFHLLKKEIEDDILRIKSKAKSPSCFISIDVDELKETSIVLFVEKAHYTYWIGDSSKNSRCQLTTSQERDEILLTYYTWEQLRLWCKHFFFYLMETR